MIQSRDHNPSAIAPQPAWEIARLLPEQGSWTESDYLYIARITNRHIELVDGCVLVPVMPTKRHQRLVAFLFQALAAFVEGRKLGEVYFAPISVRVAPGRLRQPDVLCMLAANAHRAGESVWDGADLVMEVVSEDDPDRDLIVKRLEYAAAGIGEYWIVDPRSERITVLTLPEGAAEYAVAGEYGPGAQAVSPLLPGFAVDVLAVFASGKLAP